jgi:hypothetical protein
VVSISDMRSGNCRYVISPPPYPVPQRGEGVNKELCMCYTLPFILYGSMQCKYKMAYLKSRKLVIFSTVLEPLLVILVTIFRYDI